MQLQMLHGLPIVMWKANSSKAKLCAQNNIYKKICGPDGRYDM